MVIKLTLTRLQLEIRQMSKELGSSRATVKHMKHQSASEIKVLDNQLRHQRVNIPLHEKKGKKRWQPFQTALSEAGPNQFKKENKPTTKKHFNQSQSIRVYNKSHDNNKELSNCTRCKDTKHRPG